MQASARLRLFWTLAVTAPALVSVASFGTLPVFVMEHISLSGKGDGPLGAAAADVAVGVLFGLAATLIIGHLRVALAHAVQPHFWVSSKYGSLCSCLQSAMCVLLRYNLAHSLLLSLIAT